MFGDLYTKSWSTWTEDPRKFIDILMNLQQYSVIIVLLWYSFIHLCFVFCCCQKYIFTLIICTYSFIWSLLLSLLTVIRYPPNICLFKFKNRNSRERCEICSKLPIKTSERRQWRKAVAIFLSTKALKSKVFFLHKRFILFIFFSSCSFPFWNNH